MLQVLGILGYHLYLHPWIVRVHATFSYGFLDLIIIEAITLKTSDLEKENVILMIWMFLDQIQSNEEAL